MPNPRPSGPSPPPPGRPVPAELLDALADLVRYYRKSSLSGRVVPVGGLRLADHAVIANLGLPEGVRLFLSRRLPPDLPDREAHIDDFVRRMAAADARSS